MLTNCVLLLAAFLLIWRQQELASVLATITYPEPANLNLDKQTFTPELGPRHKLNYKQWLEILQKEAKAVAENSPQQLTILAGDSLSLWFPSQLLPENRTWLNQAISGETSKGLLKRLDLFDRTKPEMVLVMVGINDLIRGVSDQEIINNHQQIIRYLREKHPQSQIFVQSILPHGGEDTTWEGRKKLLAIPNSRILNLNQELQKIATAQNVVYLNLYPLFTNSQGNLHQTLTTDGLHLSPQGYVVWRTALQIYTSKKLVPPSENQENNYRQDRI
ncbi:GDSL-type esterase/lipase family protein [Cronbergia sp. UHCC 0137]|nr:GDSL-type esterase/lipase family protein [Cronbergia sp. UHCC 0137]MEA5619085.1 GDSL-type esterase/lipase family protein [Cronbergia sp. UHCC 0137]